MAAKTAKVLRSACLIAAACLYGCAAEQPKSAVEPEKPAEAPTPAMAQPEKPVEAPAPLIAPPQAAPERPAPKAARKAAPRRKAPVRKVAPPPPVAVAPPPPVAVPPAPSPEQERARRRDEYLAALQKTIVTFKPPSPIQVGQRVVVPLSVEPPKEAAQLAEDLRKSLAEGAAWTPRMRVQLAGADFDIAPAEGGDSTGVKDLSMTGRTEWSWAIVPKVPGTKQLTARLAILLPPGLGEPSALPAITRSVEVQATLSSSIGRTWDDYWQWILGALAAAVIAIAWWARKRAG